MTTWVEHYKQLQYQAPQTKSLQGSQKLRYLHVEVARERLKQKAPKRRHIRTAQTIYSSNKHNGKKTLRQVLLVHQFLSALLVVDYSLVLLIRPAAQTYAIPPTTPTCSPISSLTQHNTWRTHNIQIR